MMKMFSGEGWKSICMIAIVLAFIGCDRPVTKKEQSEFTGLTEFVDPLIGSGFHGHVFVGANVPFGAVQLGPTQPTDGWDWCSGYHYSDSVISGFAHTHLSGTGIGDLGDILIMPTTGKVWLTSGKPGEFNKSYSSAFSHSREVVKPGYYQVKLDRFGVNAELTASTRVGFHRYTFPKTDSANIIIDLSEGIGWDLPVQTHVEKINDSTVVGFRFSKGWANDQRIFFAAVFNKPLDNFSIYNDQLGIEADSASGKAIKFVLTFSTSKNEQVLLKVGVSPVSTSNALSNITAEIPHNNFEQVKQEADDSWNKELNKIQIKTKSIQQKKIFYTAMYHTMIAPSVFNDHNGQYRGTDKKIYTDTTFTNLTTFSLWDTYRGAHPLYTVIQPERVDDMITSMLKIYEQQGSLPVWHLMGNETYTMPGNSALPVVADAWLKGFTGFDKSVAYQAMKSTALGDDRGLKFVKNQDYIPADLEIESVSKGLEYSIDDWCFAQVCKMEGNQSDFEMFSKRGKNYQHYFDTTINFVRGRLDENKWRTPFSPFVMRHMKDDFSEGNAWQYTWLVPQDVEGLMDLMGGEEKFVEKLDSLFIVEGDLGEEASNDITGLIGSYAHGNEPGHHIPYLYGYTSQPYKTAEKVRYILDNLYKDTNDGLCGNEDVGQMSAWYILSSMGFYPVNPANGAFVFGSPLFDEVTISLPGKKRFVIRIENNSDENIYINSIVFNNKPYTKAFLLYRDIMSGGEMVISMGNKPNDTWAKSLGDRAKSIGNE